MQNVEKNKLGQNEKYSEQQEWKKLKGKISFSKRNDKKMWETKLKSFQKDHDKLKNKKNFERISKRTWRYNRKGNNAIKRYNVQKKGRERKNGYISTFFFSKNVIIKEKGYTGKKH
jgi:hypothetical protein